MAEPDPIEVHQALVWRAEAERSRLHRYTRAAAEDEARRLRVIEEAEARIRRCTGCGEWWIAEHRNPRHPRVRCRVCRTELRWITRGAAA